MTPSSANNERQQIEQAIAAQESLRGTVDDAIIEATIATLKKEQGSLDSLPEQQRKLATILFMDIADLGSDGLLDVVIATSDRQLILHQQTQQDPPQWSTREIAIPSSAGKGKGVRIGDLDQDGQNDIVFSCESAGSKTGVGWLSYTFSVSDLLWDSTPISGTSGSKFDLVQLLDLDGDGDLDVITTEEDANLGVIWYENPSR